jgi:hypothetical protein
MTLQWISVHDRLPARDKSAENYSVVVLVCNISADMGIAYLHYETGNWYDTLQGYTLEDITITGWCYLPVIADMVETTPQPKIDTAVPEGYVGL